MNKSIGKSPLKNSLTKRKMKQVQQATIQSKINLEKIQEEYHGLTKTDEIFRENISDLDKKLFGLFFSE